MLRLFLVACVSLLSISAAAAELADENLLVTVPSGYKIDFQQRKNNVAMTEMVPSGESVKNWTEMVTVQIFFGAKFSPIQFKQKLDEGWTTSCAGASLPSS